jgi:hypothetical protein
MKKIEPKSFKEEMGVSPDNKKMYPNFYIGLDYLPEAKDWEIGKTYQLGIQVKMTGMNMRKGTDKQEKGDANFDITGIEVQKVAKEKVIRY